MCIYDDDPYNNLSNQPVDRYSGFFCFPFYKQCCRGLCKQDISSHLRECFFGMTFPEVACAAFTKLGCRLPPPGPSHEDSCGMHSFLPLLSLSPFQILSWWKMRWKPLGLENFSGSCLFSPAWLGQVFPGTVTSYSVSGKPRTAQLASGGHKEGHSSLHMDPLLESTKVYVQWSLAIMKICPWREFGGNPQGGFEASG